MGGDAQTRHGATIYQSASARANGAGVRVEGDPLGQRIGRLDGVGKVTGATKYAWDETRPGMLWAKVLRSPHAHARIVRIDTAAARALPGVHAVITGQDLPPNTLQGFTLRDMPTLAVDRVRFIGDRVAAIAAETPDLAEEALDLIDVEYEELPAVFDVEAAAAPGAPRLHEGEASYAGQPPAGEGNVFSLLSRGKGDVEAGFAEADLIVEDVFRTQIQHQFYMEPHNSLCWLDEDGTVHLRSSNKGLFETRRQVAETTGLPPEQIVVHYNPCGGDFGGKGTSLDDALCYFLAKAANRPVKLVLSPTEEFRFTNPRHPAVLKLKTGLKQDGTIVARDAEILWDSGAYGGFKPVPVVNVAGFPFVLGPYRMPNGRVVSKCVYTNTVPHGHMRAPGVPQAVFAAEVHTDRCARAVGLDPFEFRVLNAVEAGDTSPTGDHWAGINLKELLAVARETSRWAEPLGAQSGRGIALATFHIGAGRAGCEVRAEPTGTIRYVSAMTDPGTGSRTIIPQMIASVLDLPLDLIDAAPAGTDAAAYDQGSGASRVTFISGTAAVRAATELRQKLLLVATDLLEAPEELIELKGGRFFVTGNEHRAATLAEVAAAAAERGENVAHGEMVERKFPEEPCFAVFTAEVTVDPETGKVRTGRCVLVQDVGFAVNPLLVEAQLQGGFVQGFGFGVMEDLRLEDGNVVNPSLGEYKVPCLEDVPPLDLVLFEGSQSPGPWGAKSVGEVCHVGAAAAIANAVAAAANVEVLELPVTAERVLAKLRAQQD